MTTSAALLLLLGLAQEPPKPAAKPAEEKPPVYTALVGGDVYTITRGVLKGATVLIKDQKIHRVGAGLDLPEGTTKIDVSGRRVLPGFIAVQAEGLGLASGGGGGKLADSLDPYQESIRIALSGGVTSACVEAGGGAGMFGPGPSAGARASAVIKMSYGTLDGMVLREPASHSLQAWLSGTSAERHDLRQHFLRAREHLEKEREFEKRRAENKLKPNEAPPKLAGTPEVYLRLIKGELIARIAASDADTIKRALDLIGEFRLKAVLTDVVEGWTVAEEIGRARAWCVITPRNKAHADRNLSRPSGSSIEQGAILRKAGVTFAILPPTASISTGGIAGKDLQALPVEAAIAVRGGLEEAAALEAITIGAAEICGVEARVGSIEEGKDADLIVLDGDPLDTRTFVDLTFVNGKLLYDKSKSPYFNHLRR